jgi:hypothetical protein
MIRFRRSLDRVKFGLILRARKHDLRRLSTIHRLQFSTISPVTDHFSNPSVKGLDFTTKTDCALHLQILAQRWYLGLLITGRNHVSRVNIWKSILAFLRCRKQRVHSSYPYPRDILFIRSGYPYSLRRFEACSCKLALRDLPPSLV